MYHLKTWEIFFSAVLAVDAFAVTQAKPDAATSKTVEQKFEAVIVSADPARHSIRVRHKVGLDLETLRSGIKE